MKTYTVDQFRTYLQNVDSFGDALYYLEDIDKVFEKAKEEEEENTPYKEQE